jgi:hypothetical protein
MPWTVRIESILVFGLLAACSADGPWRVVPVDGSDIRTRDVLGVGEEIWVRPLDSENLLHFDGVSWTRTVTDQPGGTVWPAAAGDFWLANDGLLFRSTDALSWSPVDLAAMSERAIDSVEAVFGSGPDNVWLIAVEAAGQLLLHWDGEAWTASDGIRAIADEMGVQVIAGASRSEDDVWLVGSDPASGTQARLFWDGSEWAYDERDTGEYFYNRLLSRGPDLWLDLNNDSTVSSLFRRDGDEWVETSFAEPVVHVRDFEPSSVPGEGWAVGDDDSLTIYVWHIAGDTATDIGDTEAFDGHASKIWTTDAGRTFVVSNHDATDSVIIYEHVE